MFQEIDIARSYYTEIVGLFALNIAAVGMRVTHFSRVISYFFYFHEFWRLHLSVSSKKLRRILLVRIVIFGGALTSFLIFFLTFLNFSELYEIILTEQNSLANPVKSIALNDLLGWRNDASFYTLSIFLLLMSEYFMDVFRHVDALPRKISLDKLTQYPHLYSKALQWQHDARAIWVHRFLEQSGDKFVDFRNLSDWDSWRSLVSNYKKAYHEHVEFNE